MEGQNKFLLAMHICKQTGNLKSICAVHAPLGAHYTCTYHEGIECTDRPYDEEGPPLWKPGHWKKQIRCETGKFLL